jgi:hypothetical protein
VFFPEIGTALKNNPQGKRVCGAVDEASRIAVFRPEIHRRPTARREVVESEVALKQRAVTLESVPVVVKAPTNLVFGIAVVDVDKTVLIKALFAAGQVLNRITVATGGRVIETPVQCILQWKRIRFAYIRKPQWQ